MSFSEAVKWIVRMLEENGIPYQISGGLAATLYGSSRELNDIDIMVPDRDMERIANLTHPYIKTGPWKHEGPYWNLMLLSLDYNGQSIEIGGADTCKIKDNDTDEWADFITDFSKSEEMEFEWLRVKVIPKEYLIRYKSILDRKMDRKDIEEIS